MKNMIENLNDRRIEALKNGEGAASMKSITRSAKKRTHSLKTEATPAPMKS